MSSPKIIKLIRKVVREEVRKAIKPMVNEVLAEHFLKVMAQKSNGGSSLTSVLEEAQEQQVEPTEDRLVKRQAYEKAQMKQKIQDLTGGDPMAKMIFEDIDDRDRAAINTAVSAPNGAFVDMDDEGVDLSQFGL